MRTVGYVLMGLATLAFTSAGCGKKTDESDHLALKARYAQERIDRVRQLMQHHQPANAATECDPLDAGELRADPKYVAIADELVQLCTYDEPVWAIRTGVEAAEKKAAADVCKAGSIYFALDVLRTANREDAAVTALIARFKAVCPDATL